MKNILIFATMMALVSCSNKKDYKYVEIREETELDGGKSLYEVEEIIEADNDTLAFIRAYQKFIVSKKVREDLKNVESQFPTKVKAFKLFDEGGKDIVNIAFSSREAKMKEIEKEIEKDIEEKISSVSNKSEGLYNSEREAVVDSVKAGKLKPLFVENKDEFEGYTWVQPKSRPIYRNQNGFYCYFQKSKDNKVSNLRFVGQYEDEDWLFINHVKFNIDGVVWDYTPNKVNQDNDSRIWEWFDDDVNSSNALLIEAISNAKVVNVRFIGRQYHDERKMSKNNIQSIRNTLEYYKALGGKY